MPTAGLVRTHRASIVSDAVPRLIGAAGPAALRVQSVYRSVVNIAGEDGLLTVAAPAGGGLPNGILADLGADWRVIGIQPGMRVAATHAAIRLPDAAIEIDIAGSPRWSPRFRRPSPGAAQAGTERWRRRAPLARSIARAHATAGSMGALLGDDTTAGSRDPVLVARPVVARIATALVAGDARAATDAAARLIGLGPGLTPSGDDLLVGMEASLHALAHPAAGFIAPGLQQVESRTTQLAATFLRHAAAGEFAERLHALLAALLWSGEDAIPAAVERAVAWGATSGSDCLVGVIVGLDIAVARGTVA